MIWILIILLGAAMVYLSVKVDILVDDISEFEKEVTRLSEKSTKKRTTKKKEVEETKNEKGE